MYELKLKLGLPFVIIQIIEIASLMLFHSCFNSKLLLKEVLLFQNTFLECTTLQTGFCINNFSARDFFVKNSINEIRSQPNFIDMRKTLFIRGYSFLKVRISSYFKRENMHLY